MRAHSSHLLAGAILLLLGRGIPTAAQQAPDALPDTEVLDTDTSLITQQPFLFRSDTTTFVNSTAGDVEISGEVWNAIRNYDAQQRYDGQTRLTEPAAYVDLLPKDARELVDQVADLPTTADNRPLIEGNIARLEAMRDASANASADVLKSPLRPATDARVSNA